MGKFFNLVLGRDERLKRVADTHSNLSTSGMFRQRKSVKTERIVIYHCAKAMAVPGEIPSDFYLPNTNNISASVSKTIGD